MSLVHFSAKDEEAIGEAVAVVEKETSGGIVPYYIDSSSQYPEAAWKALATGGLIGLLVAVIFLFRWHGWGGGPSLELVLFIIGGGAGVELIRRFPTLRRRAIGTRRMHQAVWQRAHLAFLEQEVFDTQDRTGILIFLSLFERQVVVLADRGIHSKVSQAEWQTLADGITLGIRSGRATQALIEAIHKAGALLKDRAVTSKDQAKNELPNELRKGTAE